MSPASRSKSRESGLTLVEVAVAMFILSLSAIVLGQSLLRGVAHGTSLEDSRRSRAVCQSILMDVGESQLGSTETVGSLEYMKAYGPLSFSVDGLNDEQGSIQVEDVTPEFDEAKLSGKVYRITVRFRGQVYHSYRNELE